MKYIYLLIAFMAVGVCMGQTPVLSITTSKEPKLIGAYYKDINNDFDNFTGTWKYTNGTTALTITLQKKLQYHETAGNENFYVDVLVGEYKYVENGVEKINTLSQLFSNLTNPFAYNIAGYVIAGPTSVYCQNCAFNERTVLLTFNDPNRDIIGLEPEMLFRRADSGGVQKLKLKFRSISSPIALNGQLPQYTSYTIPFGEYLLVKQP